MGILFIGILVLLVIVLFFKFHEFRHKFGTYFIIIAILLLVVSVYHVYSSQDHNLSGFEGVVSLGKSYFLWLSSFGNNLGQISGFVVQQNWGSSNSTKVSQNDLFD